MKRSIWILTAGLTMVGAGLAGAALYAENPQATCEMARAHQKSAAPKNPLISDLGGMDHSEVAARHPESERADAIKACSRDVMGRVEATALQVITGPPWLEIFKTLAAVSTVFVAWRALQTWKRQDKAKREADFLDQLTGAMHDFIGTLPEPIAVVQLIQIRMKTTIPMQPKNSDPMIAGAIEYIERPDNKDGKHLSEALEGARPIAARLQALSAKGRVFKFQNYKTCEMTVDTLVWQFSRMQRLAVFIKHPHWYWENPEIIERLKSLMATDEKDIQAYLQRCHDEIIDYVTETYGRIYGS